MLYPRSMYDYFFRFEDVPIYCAARFGRFYYDGKFADRYDKDMHSIIKLNADTPEEAAMKMRMLGIEDEIFYRFNGIDVRHTNYEFMSKYTRKLLEAVS